MKNKNFKLFMWLFLLPFFSMAQSNSVTVTAVVYPPFSPRFSYYVDNPNKINVTLINTSGQPLSVYVSGTFSGDNGVVISTESGFKPSAPLLLDPNVPFQLTQYNIGNIFSADHLSFSGITQSDLINSQGLPEGNYQVCFTVFDYNTNQQLSADEPGGCSNNIMVQYVDPPNILYPYCGDSIVASTPQNLLFSWTIPVQTGMNIKYRFMMVEMHPGDRNPQDALESAVPPYFYELETNINQLIMGASEPQLMAGRSYAFVVQAVDPNNEIVFKNNGVSEACWFTYKGLPEVTPIDTDSLSLPDITDFTHDFELIPSTNIQGQLHYKLASKAGGTGSSGSSNASGGGGASQGGANYQQLLNGNLHNGGSANSNTMGMNGFPGMHITNPNSGNLSFQPPFGSGNMNASTVSIANAEPLRNTMIRLVVRFGTNMDDGFFNTRGFVTESGVDGSAGIADYTFYDLNGKRVSHEKILSMVNQVLDVTTTDNQGNFTFNFQTDFFTGPVYGYVNGQTPSFGNSNYEAVISLKVEVINQKFCSPDVEIFAKPGDNITLPPQVALIKDYDLHLQVTSSFDYYQGNVDSNTYLGHDRNPKAIPGGKPIPNAIVKVLRDVQKLDNEHPSVLMAEGQQLGSITKNENGEFKDVFIGKTDTVGRILIPHLVEHWAMTDGENQSPYFFSVRTRPEQADSSYENTIYNYEPFFGTIQGMRVSVESSGSTLLDDDAGFTGTAPVIYNHFYTPPASASDRTVRLNAAAPEIKGRLMAESNLENVPVTYGVVHIYEQMCKDCNTGFYDKQIGFPNHAGFFRFKNLQVDQDENGAVNGPYRRIYYKSSVYKSFIWPPTEEKALNLKFGELFFKEFQLVPKQKLKGEVVDETGKPVAAYVKTLPDSPYTKTESRWEYDNSGNIYVSAEVFETAVSNGINRIEIQPLSNSYFADTVTVAQFDPNQRMTFTVYRKMHRLKLQVRNNETNKAIAHATVLVGDTLALGTTDDNGNVELLFPSPGEQFLVRVKADGFSPQQASFNIPVSNGWQYEAIGLHPAMSIQGVISQQGNNTPLDSALVYIQLQNTDGHSLYLEAYSGTDGKYKLNGIPMTLTQVEVHVVKNGKNPSYVGQTKNITINPFAYPVPSYDFQLKAVFMDLTNIWGFPVSVESLVSKQGHPTTISGYFHDLPHVLGFDAADGNEKIYFNNLKINTGSNGKIVPESNNITTESYSLPIKTEGGFGGDLYDPTFSFWKSYPLKVSKAGDYAKLSGALQLDLASFKFAYDFHGDLFLGDDTLHNQMVVFKSTAPGQNRFFFTRRYLFDLRSDMARTPIPVANFRVFGFNASSDFSHSYFQDGMIHIGTTLHTDIPLPNGKPALDLKVKAGEIQITKENLDLKHNAGDQLSFELEKWKIVSTHGWTFDKTRDAIVIPKGTIYTGLGVDAAIAGLNVRPDALREGKIDMQNGLSLGGITKLALDKNVEPKFNYDAGVGHYRISLVGTAQGPVAWINKLPATNDRLEFTSLGMLSNNSTVLSLGKHMLFHNMLNIFVDQIMSGEGFFKLAGMPELGIPGFVPTRAVMTFTKKNGKLNAKMESLDGVVDCNGNVAYRLQQNAGAQTLTDNLYTSYGDFYVKPPPGKSGEKIMLKGLLTKTPSTCYIDVLPQTVKMGKEAMDVFEGKIAVSDSDWGNLAFKCHTHSTGLDNNNVVSFLVHGGIEANSSGVKVNNINTPLGNLNMAYIFPEKALVGQLTIKTGLDMGFASIQSGMMATRFDPHGFYLGFSGDITLASDTYSGGFLLGVYDADLNNVAQPLLHNFETGKPDFSSLHGFYAIGQRTLIDKTFSLLIIDVSAKAGLGAFVHLDYSDELFQIGGYGFAKMKGGVNVTGCGFVGVSQSAYANVKGTYHNGELSISTCQTAETCVGACGLEGCITILSRIKLSTGHSDFTLKLGGSCDDYND